MRRIVLSAALCLGLAARGSGAGKPTVKSLPRGVRLTAADFKPNGPIPRDETCDGAGRKPRLRIAAVPPGARALALIVHDPDAPSGDFMHWTVYDIPPSAKAPSGVQGRNDLGKVGYAPPCPPPGVGSHDYVFDLYALRGRTRLPAGARPEEVRGAISRLALARGSLVGTYGRR